MYIFAPNLLRCKNKNKVKKENFFNSNGVNDLKLATDI